MNYARMSEYNVLTGVLLFTVAPALAGNVADCECDARSLQQQIDSADVVFAAEVSDISEDLAGCGRTGNYNYALIVKEVFKGQVRERISLTSPPPNDDCGLQIEHDVEYLFFATENDIREVATNVCRPTKLLEDATVELSALGEGYPPKDAGGCSSLLFPRIEWLLVLAMAGAWIARRARRTTDAR